MRAEPLLQIQDLRLELPDGRRLLDGVTLDVAAGQSLGVVGESGSGKSLTAMSVMGLLPRLKAKGSIVFQKHELLSMREKERRKLRGSQMAMIFQDPMTAFLPVRSIGAQIDRGGGVYCPATRLAWQFSSQCLRHHAAHSLLDIRCGNGASGAPPSWAPFPCDT